MSTTRINYDPQLTKRLIEQPPLNDGDFFLVDVGASGGIDGFWNVYGPVLKSVGFDPLVSEVDRLNREEKNAKVCYESAFVGYKNFQQVAPPDNVDLPWFPRTSASAAMDVMQMDYTKEVFNSGEAVVMADRHVDLDDFFSPDEYKQVDFVKVDTDGHDFPVLFGAERLLREGGVLGLSVEANFIGASHDYANVFANIDRFLRGLGFSLFDLEINRYSRSALPLPFVYNIPAQTHGGQISWGEAVYLRDLAQPAYLENWDFDATEEKIVKLVTLFELFGLPDCAAELILAYRNRFPSLANPSYLDRLTPPLRNRKLDYGRYVQQFRQDIGRFFPRPRDFAGISQTAAQLESTAESSQSNSAASELVTQSAVSTARVAATGSPRRKRGLIESLRRLFRRERAA